MEEKTVHIPSINCEHCIATIKSELSEIIGVKSVDGDPAEKTITVKWIFPGSWDLIRHSLNEIGYPPEEK